MFSLFKQKKYEVFRIVVMAVIFDEHGRILLAHRTDRDFWNLPGGKLEKNEAPWEGLQREAIEEIGVTVQVNRLIGVYSYQEANYDMLVMTFNCSISNGQPSLTHESDRLAYFSKEELPENLTERHKERIIDAFAHLHETILKKQQTQ